MNVTGLLGCTEYHDNCKDNMHAALLELGLVVPFTPCSLNLFMNIPWQENGALSFEPPLIQAGRLCYLARRDRLYRGDVVLSAGYSGD